MEKVGGEIKKGDKKSSSGASTTTLEKATLLLASQNMYHFKVFGRISQKIELKKIRAYFNAAFTFAAVLK